MRDLTVKQLTALANCKYDEQTAVLKCNARGCNKRIDVAVSEHYCYWHYKALEYVRPDWKETADKVIKLDSAFDADKRTIVAAMEAEAQARTAALIVSEIEDRNKYYNRAAVPVIRCAKCNEPVITHRQSSPDCEDTNEPA